MRVLVCGGRDYDDRDHIWNTLVGLDPKPTCIIHGYATGADSEAAIVASMLKIKSVGYRADWKTHGKAAGPIRNQRMINEGRPDMVLAFPGGRGTADMVRRAKAAGLRVMHVAARPHR